MMVKRGGNTSSFLSTLFREHLFSHPHPPEVFCLQVTHRVTFSRSSTEYLTGKNWKKFGLTVEPLSMYSQFSPPARRTPLLVVCIHCGLYNPVTWSSLWTRYYLSFWFWYLVWNLEDTSMRLCCMNKISCCMIHIPFKLEEISDKKGNSVEDNVDNNAIGRIPISGWPIFIKRDNLSVCQPFFKMNFT